MTFESLKTRANLDNEQLAWWGQMVSACKAYAAGESPAPWLVLGGSKGWGKTHLAVAIVNARYASGKQWGIFLTVPDLLIELRAGFQDNSYEGRLTLLRAAPLLVLDDLGVEYHRHTNGNEGSWAEEQLYLVLNHRYLHQMETVVTTNVQLDRLDPRLADRLLDSGTGLVQVWARDLPSYRSGMTW